MNQTNGRAKILFRTEKAEARKTERISVSTFPSEAFRLQTVFQLPAFLIIFQEM